jgi:hypothetical protein
MEGGKEEDLPLKDLKPKGHPLKGHHLGNTQGKDHSVDIESPTEEGRTNEHSVLEIIQLNHKGGNPERKIYTINKGKERIPVCKGVIQREIGGVKEDKHPLLEIKDNIMMKEGKIHIGEERQERAKIQGTIRDMNKGWTVRQGNQVIGSLVEITAQTAVGKC